MPNMFVNGVNLVYEEMGTGTPLALTPGGMFGMEAVRPMADRLSSKYRVVIYDPRTRGASDLSFRGGTELENRADDLYELLSGLEATPAYLGGVSLGCSVSLQMAVRHPEAVKGLLLWDVGLGYLRAEQRYGYVEQYIEMALRDGMKGVAESEFYSELIKQNPSNRDRLMSMTPEEFVDEMQRLLAEFSVEKPVLGCTEDELRSVQAPAVIFPGNNESHPIEAGENLHRLLPHSELHPPRPLEELALKQQDYERSLEVDAERMSTVFLPFLARLEGAEVSEQG